MKAGNLYDYLKDKYGVSGTEFFNEVGLIKPKIEVIIPGVRKNNEEHKWVIFIEVNNKNVESLIIAQEWPNCQNAWSRYLEVIDYSSSGKYPDFIFKNIVNHSIENDELRTLKTFLEIFEDFLKTF
jgi:hypothetical protein